MSKVPSLETFLDTHEKSLYNEKKIYFNKWYKTLSNEQKQSFQSLFDWYMALPYIDKQSTTIENIQKLKMRMFIYTIYDHKYSQYGVPLQFLIKNNFVIYITYDDCECLYNNIKTQTDDNLNITCALWTNNYGINKMLYKAVVISVKNNNFKIDIPDLYVSISIPVTSDRILVGQYHDVSCKSYYNQHEYVHGAHL